MSSNERTQRKREDRSVGRSAAGKITFSFAFFVADNAQGSAMATDIKATTAVAFVVVVVDIIVITLVDEMMVLLLLSQTGY